MWFCRNWLSPGRGKNSIFQWQKSQWDNNVVKKKKEKGLNLLVGRILILSSCQMISFALERHGYAHFAAAALPPPTTAPTGSPSRGGDVVVYVWHKPTELAHSFLSCYCVSFCLYGPFNCISFHKFSGELSAFSLCSSGLISALFVISTIHLFMKVSFSPDIILFGWLGLKHQLTN